jgi:16S rRNA (guanine527-N7)-methyltransferase
MSNDKFQINEASFNLYSRELIEWNKKFNLTAVDGPQEIKTRHFLDSLSILDAIKLTDEKVLDIGSGAGFPGIPLKLVCPGIKLTLIEATRKKVEFLEHIVKLLDIKGVNIIWGRAEQLSKEQGLKGGFDVVVARAVAKLNVLIPYSLPFLSPKGIFVAMKQENVLPEIEEAKKELIKYQAKLNEVKVVEVGGVKRSLVIFSRVVV